MKKLLKVMIASVVVVSMILSIVGCTKAEDYSKIKAQDFVLTIKSNKEQYGIDEEILIEISLENKSGADLKIAYYFLTYLDNPPVNYPVFTEMPSETHKKTFKNNETIRMTEHLGGYYSLGQHEIKYDAVFYLGWETEKFKMRIPSNTIKISIVEP